MGRLRRCRRGGSLVTTNKDGSCQASLLLEGIHCAACIWLNETYLQRRPGVLDVSINFVSRRARVRWDPRQSKLSDLLRAVAAIGYRAYPYDMARREALARREARTLLKRTAIAALIMMQVMMFAVPAYISIDAIAPEQEALLEWASLVLTLPALLYCAAPFFTGALRDLRLGRLGMSLAFAAPGGGWLQRTGAKAFGAVLPVVKPLLQRPGAAGRIALGLLWGLLPCGLVYSVLPLALFAGGAWQGGAVMLAFGLGTLPNLMAANVLLGRARRAFDGKALRYAVAAVLIAFGLSGIWRVLYDPGALARGPFCLVS
jgi:copper chaperone CopZ